MKARSMGVFPLVACVVILFYQSVRADMNYYAVEVNRAVTITIDHRQSTAGGLSAIKGTLGLSGTDAPSLSGCLSYQDPSYRLFLGERESEPGEISLGSGSFKGLEVQGPGRFTPVLYLGDSPEAGGRLLALGYRIPYGDGGKLSLTLASKPGTGFEAILWAKSQAEQAGTVTGSVSGGLSYGGKGPAGTLELEWRHVKGSLDIGTILRADGMEAWQKADASFGPDGVWRLVLGNRAARGPDSGSVSQGISISRSLGSTGLTLSAKRDKSDGAAAMDLSEASLSVSKPLPGGLIIQKITRVLDRAFSLEPYYKGEIAAIATDRGGGGISVYGAAAWNGSGLDYSASISRDWQLNAEKYGKVAIKAETSVTEGVKSDAVGFSFGQSAGPGRLSAELGASFSEGDIWPRASIRYEWGLPAKLPPMTEGSHGELRVKRLTEVRGIVYRDCNYNGIYDSGDKPLPNITAVLDGTTRSMTDINGVYRFGKIEEGKHKIRLDMASVPLDFSYDGSGYDFFLTDGYGDYSFGLTAGATVRGRVIRADAGDGIQDALLRLSPGDAYAMTDADGTYVFENVKPGSYNVELVESDYAPEGLPMPEPQSVRVAQEPVYRMNDMAIGGSDDGGQGIEWNEPARRL